MKTSALLRSSLLLLAFSSSLFAGCARDARGSSPTGVVLTAENARVVVAPDAPKTVWFAAEEMTNFLSQVLGSPVPIAHELEPQNLNASTPQNLKTSNPQHLNIVLGTNKWSAAAGLHPETLPRDSFVISTSKPQNPKTSKPQAPNTSKPQNPNTSKPDTIFISGCDDPTWDPYAAWKNGHTGERQLPYERATLFGVYDFLERYAGIRFYFPGELGTIVPKKALLEIPVGTRTESPDFIKRTWYSPGGALMEGEDLGLGWKPWDGRRVGFIQFMRLRRMTTTPLVHAIRHMQLKERFGKTHPEYFNASRKKDGTLVRNVDPSKSYTHLCWSSGVMDEIYKDWVAYAKGLPPESRGIKHDPDGGPGVWPRLAYSDGLVGLSPDDGFTACECDACRAAYGTDQRTMASSYASKLVWSRTAELARRLKKDGIPLMIEQSAYTVTLKRPEGVELPDNVVVHVCYTGPWAEGAPARRDADLAEVKAWSEKAGGAKVFLHNWALKWSRTNIPDLPCWSPRSVGSYFARVAPWAKGTYMESSSDRYAHVFMNCYILGKVAWDTSFDWKAAVNEHYELMYGPAAPEMKQFFDDCERCWVGKITAGKVEYNALGPVQRTPTKFEIWRTVYTEEKLAEWSRLFETAEEKVKVKGEGEQWNCNTSTPQPPNTSRPQNPNTSTPQNLYLRRVELMKRNVLDPVVKARKDFVEWTDASKEEARRKREGVKNLLDKEYAYDFDIPEDAKTHDACRRIPFAFEPNTTYRLSFFLEAENVKPDAGYSFCGALVGVWSDVPQRWNFSFGTGAVVGSTAGRVHQSMILKTTKDFKAKEISVWLRGASGRMKVDGLIMEKVK